MIKYVTPELEKLVVETEDIVLASGAIVTPGPTGHQHTFVNGKCTFEGCTEVETGKLPEDEF